MAVLQRWCKSIFIVMLIALAAVQTACGFHLRGAVGLPAHITPLYLDLSTTDDELGRELVSLLAASGEHNLAVSEAEAKTVLKIVNVQSKQRVVAVDSLGRAREYELSYQFRYELQTAPSADTQPENIKSSHVELKRNLLFDPDSVLAVGHEREAMYKDMRKDAAQSVLRQLNAIEPAETPSVLPQP